MLVPLKGLTSLVTLLMISGDVNALSFMNRLRLKAGGGSGLREEVVGRYFDGVTKKDRDQIASCFGKVATIRDVFLSDRKKNTVQPVEQTVSHMMT